jgi:hypothetical protein
MTTIKELAWQLAACALLSVLIVFASAVLAAGAFLAVLALTH